MILALLGAGSFFSSPLYAQAAASSAASAPQAISPQEQEGIDRDIGRHFGDAPANPGPKAKLSGALRPADVRAATRKVADWEMAWSQPYFDRIWTWSVLYSGFMAVTPALDDSRYRDAMRAMSEKFRWQLRSEHPNADDQSIGQTYLAGRAGRFAGGWGSQNSGGPGANSVVVVRRPVHGAPRVVADVSGCPRQKVSRLSRHALVGNVEPALRPALAPLFSRRNLHS
jgi:hypothetical protein